MLNTSHLKKDTQFEYDQIRVTLLRNTEKCIKESEHNTLQCNGHLSEALILTTT